MKLWIGLVAFNLAVSYIVHYAIEVPSAQYGHNLAKNMTRRNAAILEPAAERGV